MGEFERKSYAKAVSKLIDGHQFAGQVVRVQFLEESAVDNVSSEHLGRAGETSKIILLENLTSEIAAVDLESQILAEARKFGRVRKCFVRKGERDGATPVSVFVAFRVAADAASALADFNGRLRKVLIQRASFFDEQRFKD